MQSKLGLNLQRGWCMLFLRLTWKSFVGFITYELTFGLSVRLGGLSFIIGSRLYVERCSSYCFSENDNWSGNEQGSLNDRAVLFRIKSVNTNVETRHD